MSDIKYTKSGKKVAVLGKLNDTEWIVQEIFVANGQEFPAGENFVEKGLLNAPAETWKEQNAKSLEERANKLEAEIKRLDGLRQQSKTTAMVQSLINRCLESYPAADVSQLDTLFAFMSGDITHVVSFHYGEGGIATLSEMLQDTDNHYGHIKVEGLKLVSLFGVKENGKRWDDSTPSNLEWRINTYRDGSGGWATVYPCRSYDEAVGVLDRLVGEKEHASDSLIALKEKYGLANPTADKIADFHAKRLAEMEKQAADIASRLEKKREEIRALKTKGE